MPKRRRKTILLWLSAILILLVAAIGITLATLDDDYYRESLIRAVDDFTDYRMEIDGPFNLSLSLSPTVSASKVKLFPEGASESLDFDQLQLQIALLPLLSGEMHLKQLAIDGFTIDLGADVTSPERKGFQLGDPPDIPIPFLESIALRNIHLNYKEPGTDSPLRIELQELTLAAAKDGDSLLVNGRTVVDGTAHSIRGRLGLVANLLSQKAPYPLDLEIESNATVLSVKGNIDKPR